MKMKTNQLILGGMTAMLFACSAPQKDFVLTGKIENSPVSYILVGDGTKSVEKADTIHLAADGTFNYTYRCEKPSFGFLYVPEKAFYNLIMINGCNSQLTADANRPLESKWEGDLKEAYAFKKAVDMKFSGKTEAPHTSFTEMKQVFAAFVDSVKNAIDQIPEKDFQALELESLKSSIDYNILNYHEQLASAQKPADSDVEYNRFMEKVDLNNKDNLQVYLRWKEACAGREKKPSCLAMLQLVKQKVTNPKTLEAITMSLLIDYFSDIDANLEEVYNTGITLLKDQKDKEYITGLYDKHKRLIPGTDAIDCELTTPEGKTLKLSDLYGKVLYLDIWATWCGPCCEEIPYMEKLAEHFKNDKRVELISISIDAKKKEWLNKLAKDKPQWKQFLCGDFTDKYGITGIPCFLMIDKFGKLITMQAPKPSEENCIEFIKEHLK